MVEAGVGDCAGQSPPCDGVRCIPIDAWPVDMENECLQPRVDVGCVESGMTSGASLASAVDEDGSCWVFGSTRVASGFVGYFDQEWDPSSPCTPAGSWQECPDAGD